MIKQYRKKPIVIEAMQWRRVNHQQIRDFLGDAGTDEVPRWWIPPTGDVVFIKTLEGLMRADKGDWIIRGVNGEFYPCKPDIFAKTYEEVQQ